MYFGGIPWAIAVVKNLPCNAGDVGSIPGQGTKIPHAAGQLSPWATTRVLVPQGEILHDEGRSFVPKIRPYPAKKKKKRCILVCMRSYTNCSIWGYINAFTFCKW